jgi:predicted esterase
MPPQEVEFKARNDGTVQAYMELKPADFDAAKHYDVIIGLHGHGSNRKQYAFDPRPECASFRAFAAQHGMIAITPDYRANTSWMGPKAEEDLVQIISELKQKYKINRVFLTGGSMGGTAVLTFAALHPELINGVASLNGLANHLEYTGFQDAIAASFGGSKKAVPAEYRKRSAEFWPEKLTMPIAFTTGGNDTLVPPDSVLRLAKKLQSRNRKVLLINQPKGGHATNYSDAMAALSFMMSGTVEATPIVPAVASKPDGAVAPPQVMATGQSVITPGKGGIFFAESPPPVTEAAGKVELGLKFYVEKTGTITAFKFYKAKSETGPHTLRVWATDGSPLLSVTVPAIQESGWLAVPLQSPFPVAASTEYTLSYSCNSHYVGTPGVFVEPVRRDGIMALSGLYSFSDLGQKVPYKTFKQMNYFLDIIYVEGVNK